MLNKVVFALSLFVVFGCKARKSTTPAVTAIPQQKTETMASFSNDEILKQISAKQVKFNTIAIKAKADLSINNKNNDVSMNIRMQKGEVIWISVSFPVIGEIARTLITPDSIKIINKFENTYTRKPFSYAHQFVNQQVDINTLQDIFIGNAIEGTLSTGSAISVSGEQTSIQGDLSGLIYSLIFNANRNLIQNNLDDKKASQTLNLNYREYSLVSGQEIPLVVSIKSQAASKTIGVDLKYNNVELNVPMEFPFNVPKRFTVKE